MADKIKVGILRGGEGKHFISSLHRGGDIISHIFENLSGKYKTVDILIDKNDSWHLNGVPINPVDLAHKVDIFWDTTRHPNISTILDNLSVPNIGNTSFLKILENNNNMLQKHIKDVGIKMPRSILLPLYQKDFDGSIEKYVIKKAKEIFEKFSSPWVVKSFTSDSNMGIHLAKTFPELVDAIEDGVAHQKSILVEEFILGKVVSVHSVADFRREDIYVFPINNPFTGQVSLLTKEKEQIISLVKDLHKHLAVKHYLKSDFILHPRRGLFLTNIDFLPDLRVGSHFEKSCEYVGAKMHHVIEHILNKAK
ncbi:MAG: hypothetical protein WC822_03260 [Candidatus Paceibacterota bacterium]|jgi:D-alanine-D-alanine ligase-like ATP-grasp enzyme